MARKQQTSKLSEAELRYLLLEKKRVRRQARMEHLFRTGRIRKYVPVTTVPVKQSEDVDDDPGLEPDERPAARPARRRPWLDRLLLSVEIVAVVGLVVVLLNGVGLMRTLNRETTALLQQGELTPTALFMSVVLPSGHTPPNAPGGVQPNEAEIPEHLRPLVQSMANLPVPTAGPEQAVRIQIPAIGVDAPVVQGDGWEQLKKGVGQHVGTANPGEDGNVVLAAHNDVFGEIFRDLDRLQNGDQIILFTNQRTYTYVIDTNKIVEPTAVEVMAPTNVPIVTLISCYPYLVSNQRIVVSGSLQER
ncbi:MAG: class D sortase [Anaerolineae bacterium]|nr:class D sortase [Anaerolineae bacterium]